jgi:tetratricopeptide (TPR) repeat protein
MTSENKEHSEGLETVEHALSSAEQFIERNQKILLYILGAIVLVILLFFLGKYKWLAPREKNAQSQMYVAEQYFEKDSFNLALNGDGNYPGFLDIIDDYSFTKSADLSHYYAGICYLHLGKFEDAVKQLKKFDGDDIMLSAIAKGAIGDAYVELGKLDDAVDYYKDAADNKDNEFVCPIYLMKAAQVYEEQNKFDKALDIYEEIQTDFPRSVEGRGIEKYITRAKLMSQK